MNNRKKLTDRRLMKEKSFWDKIASNYDRPSRLDAAYRLSVQRCLNLLEGKERVIEMACGTGTISIGIAEKAASVIGIDASANMINAAKNKLAQTTADNISFEVGDGYHTRFSGNSFDVVLLFNALHIVKEPDRFLAEAYRILKADGIIVTATDCYSEKVPFTKKIYTLVPGFMKKLGIISYLSSYRKADVEKLIEKNNFKILSTENLFEAPVNYYILAKKVSNEIEYR